MKRGFCYGASFVLSIALAALAAPSSAQVVAASAKPTAEALTRPKPTAEALARPKPAIEAQRTRFLAKASPKLKAKLPSLIAPVVERAGAKPKPKEAPVDLVATAKTSLRAAGYGDGADIQALVFLVLMEAAKAAEDDLRATLEKIKAANEMKRCLRAKIRGGDCKGNVRTRFEPVLGKAVTREITEGSLDSLSEMGELQQLSLQESMARMQKLMETLSNLMKKISDTNASIIANMK
jgi:hypothetical protein